MHPKIHENKHYIIIAGFAIGFALALEILPLTTEFFGIGDYAKFIWAGLIAGVAYLYYTLNMQSQPKKPIRPPTPRPKQRPLPEQPTPEIPPVVLPSENVYPPQKFPMPRKSILQEFDEKVKPKSEEKESKSEVL